jgi:hypothetical protein
LPFKVSSLSVPLILSLPMVPSVSAIMIPHLLTI